MPRFRKFLMIATGVVVALACVAVAAVRAAAPRGVAGSAPQHAFTPTADTKRAGAAERWRTSLPVPVVGLPEADVNGIVVTAGESEVVALANDGRVQWTTAVAGALVNAPRLDADLVFVAAKRAVAALRRDSGAVAWAVTSAADGAPDDRANRPVVVGDAVVVTTASGRARGLDRSTGAARWTVDLPTAVTSEPAAGDGVVVVVGIAQWWALDPATGATLWSGDLGTFGTSSPAVFNDGERWLAAVASSGHLVAVDAHTGQPVWEAEAEQSEPFQVPVATLAHELLVPDHWGRMTAYDVHDGHALWRVHGADGVAEFGQPVEVGPRTVALPLDQGGPRIGSPGGSSTLRLPASGHGVVATTDGALVVTTWGGEVNYLVAYDLAGLNR